MSDGEIHEAYGKLRREYLEVYYEKCEIKKKLDQMDKILQYYRSELFKRQEKDSK